ncbi:glucosamine 6-phosphate synthetase [Lysinibacillus sp. SGAir0095]|uniref:glucosamine 6-phosphate synthetase n=1 Tax=Lysinibacillus sp. SGAir0095 TaxID=2070463 RepID=UPI0010CCBCBD|nr:glucosamine 6-phosphate synthetase [Lysinibacillus sp. SGAir0095]QCR32265.1 glucosamine 6-phosphate synthetase [Lysinibacillus sp. SGAir0095]
MQNVSKRTILWIVPIAIIAIFWYFYGPQEEITDNEYITYIKESPYNESDVSFDQAFANNCTESKWVYFKTQKNHNVVEFKGTCEVENKKSDINLQFVVEENQNGYDIGVLLLNGKQQTEEQRDKTLNTIASN